MGRSVVMDAGGVELHGWLAEADSPGPAVIVIQEWWGLVGHIRDVADRFAQARITALAPDFYQGRATEEPDEAGSLMMALEVPHAAQVIQAAVGRLAEEPKVSGGIGVVGFCMGGKLAMYAACLAPEIRACVNFYGIHPNVHPDYAKMPALLGHFAEEDAYAGPAEVAELSRTLADLNRPHEFHTYPGTKHAFFNSDRPAVHHPEAAELAWQRTLDFFRKNLA
ncbi:MAG: dienelactone hydrolase family protein [Fimbriimonadaceae bacterium]|nr:dienelactone hydrolase family protein [Fimbriimonadaceae bacterium]